MESIEEEDEQQVMRDNLQKYGNIHAPSSIEPHSEQQSNPLQ
jgi:hypothetical protein